MCAYFTESKTNIRIENSIAGWQVSLRLSDGEKYTPFPFSFRSFLLSEKNIEDTSTNSILSKL